MTNDDVLTLTAIVFVYRDILTGEMKCVYANEAKRYQNSPAYEHTGKINPAAWIEYYLNHPKDRKNSFKSIGGV